MKECQERIKSVFLKTKLLRSVICLLFLSACVGASEIPAASECKEKVVAFLAHPDKSGLVSLSDSTRAACWAELESSETNVDKLNNLVEEGNRWAAQYLATNVSKLDGGNSEDALIALGRFSDHDMESFLDFAKERLFTKFAFDRALISVPLSLSDDLRARLSFLGERKNKVVRITRKDLLEQKGQALTVINESEAEVKFLISGK